MCAPCGSVFRTVGARGHSFTHCPATENHVATTSSMCVSYLHRGACRSVGRRRAVAGTHCSHNARGYVLKRQKFTRAPATRFCHAHGGHIRVSSRVAQWPAHKHRQVSRVALWGEESGHKRRCVCVCDPARQVQTVKGWPHHTTQTQPAPQIISRCWCPKSAVRHGRRGGVMLEQASACAFLPCAGPGWPTSSSMSAIFSWLQVSPLTVTVM
jgi:hypothetical protein